MTLLGYHAIQKWAEGLEGARIGEFAKVAEFIRQDIKRKLDEFMQTEQGRPYTDYQYYYFADNVAQGQQQMPVLRSPLSGRLDNYLAYGYFQIEPNGNIITPNDDVTQIPGSAAVNSNLYAMVALNRYNIENNLKPALSGVGGAFALPSSEFLAAYANNARLREALKTDLTTARQQSAKGKTNRTKQYPIPSLQQDFQKKQVITQRRSVVASNAGQLVQAAGQQAENVEDTEQAEQERTVQVNEPVQTTAEKPPIDANESQQSRDTEQARLPQAQQAEQAKEGRAQYSPLQPPMRQDQADTVQIQIEPFTPLVVPGDSDQQSIFEGQVFLLRHIQIEDKHLLQGFLLNEERLIEEIEESADRIVSLQEGMTFELPQLMNEDVADMVDTAMENEEVGYTAILDFGFGDLILNLKEINPARIADKTNWLRNWYFGIIAIVLFAVTLGLAGLWRNARAQLKLAQKKDDFISAVSHELRTPLTSIRMYSEMLEKNWVKSEEKLVEYYRNMRQESERLSRLIENVLDFSRIQRGRKKYAFSMGDLNKYIADVVEMMTPYAAQNGFSIETQFQQLGQTAFDADAVTQIVVNLLDNAVKYARNAEDKTITVRTVREHQLRLIEVEDHGPGIPHRQRKKIFEEFYRLGAEATRETTGTGLGLALVKKFAQAHNGFVEIINASPTGSIFRVALATQMHQVQPSS
jgi:signal transduction histidine kinase